MSKTSSQSFTSSLIAADSPVGQGITTTYDIDGRDVRFVAPDINQMVLMVLMIENATSDMQSAAKLIDIFFSMIDEDDDLRTLDGEDGDDNEPVFKDYTRRWLERRLMDRKDPFGVAVIGAIMGQMVEDWSARPTRASSRSSASPSSRGTTSKATPRGGASTRGRTR